MVLFKLDKVDDHCICMEAVLFDVENVKVHDKEDITLAITVVIPFSLVSDSGNLNYLAVAFIELKSELLKLKIGEVIDVFGIIGVCTALSL